MEEQNRLAKLQALEMVEDGSGHGDANSMSGDNRRRAATKDGPMTVSMADALSDLDDSDDGVDSVPTKRVQA